MDLLITGPHRLALKAAAWRYSHDPTGTDRRRLAGAAAKLLHEADQAFAELAMARAALAVALTPPGEAVPASGPFAEHVGRDIYVGLQGGDSRTGTLRAATDAGMWIGGSDGEYVPAHLVKFIIDPIDGSGVTPA
jgi:hypothetical protein